MLKVGITGGIGSGKSTVARIFGVLGIPVYDADAAAKLIMNRDEGLKAQLATHFGTDLYVSGQLDRALLASRVFANPDKLALLNSLVHPVTIADAARWMLEQQGSYALKEAALIFESGSQQDLDYVIGVYAPEALRIRRAMQRDGVTREQVKARMRQQIPDSIKMRLCDWVIVNDEQQAVIPQVLHIHHTLCTTAPYRC
jgi:dephospho-CoA kinase